MITTNKQFTITKRIAKHGSQSIIVIPRILEQHLKPGTITQVTINIIENPIENPEVNKQCLNFDGVESKWLI